MGKLGWLSAVLVLGLAGCTSDEENELIIQSTAPLSNGQVGAVLLAADRALGDQGLVGRSRASSPAVRTFADQVVTISTAARDRQMRLLLAQNIPLATSDTQLSLLEGSARSVATLQVTDPALFDTTYLTGQISLLLTLINLIDNRLRPSTTDAALAADLALTRAEAVAALEQAQRLAAAP
jgi:putative membrane protein